MNDRHPNADDWLVLKISIIVAIIAGSFTELRSLVKQKDVTVATSLIALLNIGTIGVLGGAVRWGATTFLPNMPEVVVYSIIAVLAAAGRDRVVDIVTRLVLSVLPNDGTEQGKDGTEQD